MGHAKSTRSQFEIKKWKCEEEKKKFNQDLFAEFFSTVFLFNFHVLRCCRVLILVVSVTVASRIGFTLCSCLELFIFTTSPSSGAGKIGKLIQETPSGLRMSDIDSELLQPHLYKNNATSSHPGWTVGRIYCKYFSYSNESHWSRYSGKLETIWKCAIEFQARIEFHSNGTWEIYHFLCCEILTNRVN